MKWFSIEMFFADKTVTVHIVKAKTYEDGCVKLAKIFGEANAFKCLGVFEISNVDSHVLNRTA